MNTITYKHCEYHSLDTLHDPDEQHLGPLKPELQPEKEMSVNRCHSFIWLGEKTTPTHPPHCSYRAAQPPLGGAGVEPPPPPPDQTAGPGMGKDL